MRGNIIWEMGQIINISSVTFLTCSTSEGQRLEVLCTGIKNSQFYNGTIVHKRITSIANRSFTRNNSENLQERSTSDTIILQTNNNKKTYLIKRSCISKTTLPNLINSTFYRSLIWTGRVGSYRQNCVLSNTDLRLFNCLCARIWKAVSSKLRGEKLNTHHLLINRSIDSEQTRALLTRRRSVVILANSKLVTTVLSYYSID